ncbi:hypothetical protein SDC9_56736 [bioreactor metagenome]|uniref:DUF4393 domain-containing protein n=1 Tax=bioreactor metagenome TaxID=1076179 RepID=A0A644X8D8_9ZZZZ
MQAISYSYNSKELRNMYATLLANSMNKDTQDTVHPAFVELIKQLSPLEAQILKKLYDNIEYTISYPLVKLRSTISEVDNTGIDRIEHILNSDFGVNIFNIDKYILAIDNLYRLNLISVTYISRFSDISKYESIESSDLFHDIKQKCNNMPNLNFLQVIRGKFDITSLGIAFISACVS